MNEVLGSPSTTASLASARRLIGVLERDFQASVGRVAKACAIDGKLDGARLDQQQWASYELALVAADLGAARELLGGCERGGPIDVGLAVAFVADVGGAVLMRLEAVEAATIDDTSAATENHGDAATDGRVDAATDNHAAASGTVGASRALRELRELRRGDAGPDALARLGLAVAEAGGEVANVELDEPTALARDAFRRFASDVVAPLADRIHRENLTVPEALLQPMREMGVFGLSIPEEYGGSSPAGHENTPMMIAVTEALSEASLAAAGSLITRPEILSRALLAGGTEAQKAHWLPRLAAGEPLCAIAITEPDHGSDVASLSLKGTRTAGGWLLDGAKTWCTFAGKAGVLMVVVRTNPQRTEGHRGLSLMLVEKPSYDGHDFAFEQSGGGKLAGRAIPTIGYRGMHSFDLAFEGFFVPDANVIGEEGGLGRGFYLTMAGMVGGRMQTAGRALGVMRAALKAAVRYAQERRVFNAPLIDFPLTRTKIATMAARFAACRYLSYAVGKRLDGDRGRMEASLAKLIACRSAEAITREAMQIHGGMGYAEEMPVSRYFVDARVLSIFEGAEETLALKVIARSMFEEALRA